MADNIGHNLDLEKILATLASLPKPETQSYQNQQQPYESNPAHQAHQGYQGGLQPTPFEQGIPYHQAVDPRLVGRAAPQHRYAGSPPNDKTSSPLIDPSTITEWKQGLRCVSKIAVQNPEFAAAVRKVLLAISPHM